MKVKGKHRNAFFALGMSGLLINISTACLFGMMPLLMKALGATEGLIAQMDAVAEMFSYVARMFVGGIVDTVQQRKTIFVLALAGLTFAQYGFALVTSLVGMGVIRRVQRICCGVVAVPRDVMIGGLVTSPNLSLIHISEPTRPY